MPLTTILIEDSAQIRENLLAAMAELLDVNVVAFAESPADAILALNTYKDTWQLVILDLFLRDGSGLSVLRAFQERRAEQHIVVLTNYATHEMRQRCIGLGADAVFDKSTELEAFFELCSQYSRA